MRSLTLLHLSKKQNQDETDCESSPDDVVRGMGVGSLPDNEHCGKTDRAHGKPEDDEGGQRDPADGRLGAGAGGEERQYVAHHRKDGEMARESKGAEGHREGVSEQRHHCQDGVGNRESHTQPAPLETVSRNWTINDGPCGSHVTNHQKTFQIMINIKAVQTTLNVGPQAGKDRFVLQAMTYNTLSEAKVIAETAARTNMSKQLIRACWEGCAEIIKAWATEGHSIPVPGLGHMRFGIRATSVEKVEDVKSNLITSRRVIFVPSVDIKDELAKTSISITCYDKDGKKIKTVTSTDSDDIEVDNGSTETTDPGNGTTGGNSNNGSDTGGNTGGNTSGDTGGDDNGPSGDME